MNAQIINRTQSRQDVLVPLITSLIVTNILFFIDEGCYDFRWMSSFGDWIAFVIYAGVLFLCQWAIKRFIFPRSTNTYAYMFIIITGIALGLFILIKGIFQHVNG